MNNLRDDFFLITAYNCTWYPSPRPCVSNIEFRCPQDLLLKVLTIFPKSPDAIQPMSMQRFTPKLPSSLQFPLRSILNLPLWPFRLTSRLRLSSPLSLSVLDWSSELKSSSQSAGEYGQGIRKEKAEVEGHSRAWRTGWAL